MRLIFWFDLYIGFVLTNWLVEMFFIKWTLVIHFVSKAFKLFVKYCFSKTLNNKEEKIAPCEPHREGERFSPWRHCVTVTGVSLNCTSADVIVLFWRESVTADSHNTIYSVCKQSATYSTVPCRPFNAFPSRYDAAGATPRWAHFNNNHHNWIAHREKVSTCNTYLA